MTNEFSAKKVHHKNLFRVKDKNISEISSVYLSGLSLLMNEYTETSLCGCFIGCKNLTQIVFPHGFDSSSVRSAMYMFYDCSMLTRLVFPSTFNTSNVQSMYCMFSGCSSLRRLDLSSFNTSKVSDMGKMFSGCSNLNDVKYDKNDSKLIKALNSR